jgi:DNA repair exonuclease SbcCD ATPase subunit
VIPLRVSVEGFMSYRGETELVFEGAPLWVLSGRNGSGKSAIFDAITYALYGVHRGGAQNAKALINHAAKSLSVEFDFRIGDDVYRVKRTLGRKGAPTVQAFRLDGAEPVVMAETETKAGFDGWVLDTIGLDARTFTASVLLQQGRSEALLDADPKVRHEMLGQIIDLSAYERLWERAEERHKQSRAAAEACRAQLGGLDPVDEADLGRLAEEADVAARAADLARSRIERLLELKADARRWADLDAERGRLEREIADAAALAARAEEIERRAARLDELRRVLPALERFVEAAAELAAFEEDLDSAVARARAEVEELAEVKAALPWLQLAARAREAAAGAEARAATADAESASLAIAAEAAHEAAGRATEDRDAAARGAEDAGRRATEAATLLGETQRRLARFEEVDGAAA